MRTTTQALLYGLKIAAHTCALHAQCTAVFLIMMCLSAPLLAAPVPNDPWHQRMASSLSSMYDNAHGDGGVTYFACSSAALLLLMFLTYRAMQRA